MKYSIQILLVVLGYCKVSANYAATDFPSWHAVDVISSNWVIAAKAALPEKYLSHELTFGQLTNFICKESQNMNNAARGLWGFLLLTQNSSAEGRKAGLALARNSAESGYVPVILQLGSLYEAGKCVERDYNEAFHWYSLAAEKGDAEAQHQLGRCYHYGRGTTRDFSTAVRWYRKSAEQTNSTAMKSLGYLLMNGFGVEKNIEEAKHWFTRSAKEGGNRRAMYNLGAICAGRFPDTNSMAEAFQWYKESADLGDPLACSALAGFYYRGWGVVATNLDLYFYWLLKGAELGATVAQYSLGVAYRTGDGAPKNMQESLKWNRKAAAKNEPRALYELALYYLSDKTNRGSIALASDYMLRAAKGGNREAQFQSAMSCFRGDAGAQDFENGKQWLAKAAENDWPKAEFCLFQLYYHGVPPGPGCPSYPKDKVAAVKWLRRAAQHESLQAQAVLAIMLVRGSEVEQDKVEAEKLLRYAAPQGYPEAQNDLGFAIMHGDFSGADLVEAAMWCQLAVSGSAETNTIRRAKVNLSDALSRLSADQQLEVDRRVKSFRILHSPETDPMSKGWEQNPDYAQEDDQVTSR